MISQEARDLFAANVKAMTAGDAAHLASQLLPDDVSRLKDIAYVHDGDAAHLLDIYTLADAEEGAALPVIVDFHGGGLYYGNKENNECRDMLLARQGFAVVNANYRLVPREFPRPAGRCDGRARLDSRPWRRIRPGRRARLRDRRFGRRRLGPVPLRGQRFDAAGRRLGLCSPASRCTPGGDLRACSVCRAACTPMR